MYPLESDWNLTPTSVAVPSGSLATAGVALPQRLHGHVRPGTVTVTGADRAPRFALSSVARASSAAVPVDRGTHVYVHEVVPEAGCQLLPPSVETSTPATTPPPES